MPLSKEDLEKYIKNKEFITLKWNKVSNSVIGFEVYYGTHTKDKKFLADVS